MIKVVVECAPDETLVRNLGFTSRQVKHQPNKGEVCNYLIKNSGIIGMVDADPGSPQPGFFQDCKLIQEKFDVVVYQYNDQNNRLLVLNPNLEGWLIKKAKESKLDLSNFGLPGTSKALHKEILNKIPKVEMLISELLTKKNPGLLFLKSQLLFK